ncbi:MAG: hypothetical protein IKU94_10530, partial [Bacteroidaceae bacterium]|nr:hypothetical protein [Bacteroidaceae bacterium]
MKEIILAHLQEYGSITSMEAIDKYHCTKLSHYIYLLRKDGYTIESDDVAFRDSLSNKMVAEEVENKKGFSTSADSCNDFYLAIPPALKQFLQISVAFHKYSSKDLCGKFHCISKLFVHK